MTYATRQDLEDRFGADEIGTLADPDSDGSDRTAAALDDAAAEIDGHVGAAYALPLPAGRSWPLLAAAACDLARARLHDESPPESVTAAADAAAERLEAVRDGEILLFDADGTEAPRRARPQASEGTPVFTRDALRDY